MGKAQKNRAEGGVPYDGGNLRTIRGEGSGQYFPHLVFVFPGFEQLPHHDFVLPHPLSELPTLHFVLPDALSELPTPHFVLPERLFYDRGMDFALRIKTKLGNPP